MKCKRAVEITREEMNLLMPAVTKIQMYLKRGYNYKCVMDLTIQKVIETPDSFQFYTSQTNADRWCKSPAQSEPSFKIIRCDPYIGISTNEEKLYIFYRFDILSERVAQRKIREEIGL